MKRLLAPTMQDQSPDDGNVRAVQVIPSGDEDETSVSLVAAKIFDVYATFSHPAVAEIVPPVHEVPSVEYAVTLDEYLNAVNLPDP
jgi:hypothetical protein